MRSAAVHLAILIAVVLSLGGCAGSRLSEARRVQLAAEMSGVYGLPAIDEWTYVFGDQLAVTRGDRVAIAVAPDGVVEATVLAGPERADSVIAGMPGHATIPFEWTSKGALTRRYEPQPVGMQFGVGIQRVRVTMSLVDEGLKFDGKFTEAGLAFLLIPFIESSEASRTLPRADETPAAGDQVRSD